MSEEKVYMSKLPDTCNECPCHSVMEDRCVLLRKQTIEPFLQSCPLKSLKTHDRELVKEVCEKIRKFCENNKYRCNKYFLLYSIGLNVKLLNKNKEGQKETFYEFLDQLQKEYEK